MSRRPNPVSYIKLLNSIATAEGAHHVAYTKDGRFAYVQNSLLNLPTMNDGFITLVDLVKGEAVDSIDTLKDRGFAGAAGRTSPRAKASLRLWIQGPSPMMRWAFCMSARVTSQVRAASSASRPRRVSASSGISGLASSALRISGVAASTLEESAHESGLTER